MWNTLRRILTTIFQSLCRFALIRLATRFVDDDLTLVHNGRTVRIGTHRSRSSEAADRLRAEIVVTNGQAWPRVLLGGSAGLGESWSDGFWEADDLTSAIRILARATSRGDGARSTVHAVVGPVTDRLRRLRPQDKRRDRRNIGAHYDLGNEFFEHFLDPTMMYSSAMFRSTDMTLEEASIEKIDHLCRMIDIRPGDRVLEIGTGWGGFALHAATRFGALVTTTTISAEQYTYARNRVLAAGLDDRITVLGTDYRDLTGSWDKVVSIEMIEAVDWREYDTFFSACRRLLRSGGTMGLQAIVIRPDRFERAKNTNDFIKTHIFPGGCLPSIEAIERSLDNVGALAIDEFIAFGSDYAETLRRWRTNLHEDEQILESFALDQRFIRLWDFYLCYCEAGFDEKMIDVVQMRIRATT